MATFLVTFEWVDNSGKVSEHRLHAPASQEFGGVASQGLALANVMQAVSSARLRSLTISQVFATGGDAPPSPDSDARTYALLLYRNGSDTSSIVVPSPAGVLFEVVGPYAGRRITRESAALSGLLPTLDTLVQEFLDSVGRPYGATFVVGGRL